MSKKALVVIDVQKGLFNGPNSGIYRAERLLSNINELIEKARDASVTIIFIRHDGAGLQHGTSKWQIHEDLDFREEDIFVEKKHCDSFYKTNFLEVLEKQDVKEIVVCGLQTEYCVDTACRSAAGKGIQTNLVEDAHSTVDSKTLSAKQIIEHHNDVLGNAFVELFSTKDVGF